MNNAKLKPAHPKPELYVVPSHEQEALEPSTSGEEHGPAAIGPSRLASDTMDTRPAKPKGSYCLRRSAQQMARSVYLSRVLEHLEKGYKEEGEGFLSELALVWVSGDGSREVALKGKMLRNLVRGGI